MLQTRVVFRTLLKRSFSNLNTSKSFIITPEIQSAIRNKGPVVALESTIISHGNFFFLTRNIIMHISNIPPPPKVCRIHKM